MKSNKFLFKKFYFLTFCFVFFLAGCSAFKFDSRTEKTLDGNKTQSAIQTISNGLNAGSALPEKKSIFIVSFGDIMLGRQVRTRMEKFGLDYPFAKMDPSLLRDNDLLIANLEGPVTDKAVKTSKAIAFRFPEDTAALLKKHSFDAVSLSNNHALDMGKSAFARTKELINAQGIVGFGDPRSLTDESIGYVTIGHRNIAFLGLNDVDFKINPKEVTAKIAELHAKKFLVIPFIHWGVEYTHIPNKRQIDLAHAFLDAGADAIIACHPHVVQRFEIYKGKPIFYSLGNAIFDQEFSPDTQEGLGIGLEINNENDVRTPVDMTVSFYPIKIEKSQMQLMDSKQKEAFLKKFIGWGNFSEDQKKAILTGKIEL